MSEYVVYGNHISCARKPYSCVRKTYSCVGIFKHISYIYIVVYGKHIVEKNIFQTIF